MKRARLGVFLKKHPVSVILYAVYFSLILLSVHAFIAQDTVVDDLRTNMDESYDYNLVFKHDGQTTHYDVLRHNSSENGYITLTYHTEPNKLDITEVRNIKTLKIDVNSMFSDEVEKVFKKSETEISTMDMDYWYDAKDGIFTVEFDIATGEPMESLTFNEFPVPVSVLVNNEEWWKTNINYTVSENNIIITNIPTGKTTVILYFKGANQLPVAAFTMNPPSLAGVNEDIIFNGSTSYDLDGIITSWLWDFGDNTSDSGKEVKHSYSEAGTYTIMLTVRDNAEPFGKASVEKNITVAEDADKDSDEDSLRDYWEMEHFQNLDSGPEDDNDNDQHPNALEFIAQTDPTDDKDFEIDSDNDELWDKWEWEHFKSLDAGPNDDPDNDGLTNKEELHGNTDPNVSDKKTNGDDRPDKASDGIGIEIILIIIIIIIVIIVIVAMVMKKKKAREPFEPEHGIPEQPERMPEPEIGVLEGEATPMPEQPISPEPEAEAIESELSLEGMDMLEEALETGEPLPTDIPSEPFAPSPVSPVEPAIGEGMELAEEPIPSELPSEEYAQPEAAIPEEPVEGVEPGAPEEPTETVAEGAEQQPPLTGAQIEELMIKGTTAYHEGRYQDAILTWQQILDQEPDSHPMIKLSMEDAMAKLKEQNG
jgi:PKD repeat protein